MNAFRRNLLIGFGFSLLLLIISSLASYLSISNLLESQQRVTRTTLIINQMEKLMSAIKDAETGQRGFLLTGEPAFLEPYLGAVAESNTLINEIDQLTSDNPVQQKNTEALRAIIERRLALLEDHIADKEAGRTVPVEGLRNGKAAMEEARKLVDSMQEHEQQLLTTSTGNLNRFAALTPLLIIIAFILALIVTIVSFLRVNSDLKNRESLQKELEQKDRDITRRLQATESIAAQISAGDYSVRFTDEEKDHLGRLALSLNSMAASLEKSFNDLADREWLQSGIAALNDEMIAEMDIDSLSQNIIRKVAEYSDSQAGALYLMNREDALELQGSYALSEKAGKKVLRLGENLAGQCALSSKVMEYTNLSPEDYTLSFAAGNVKPTSVIAIPILFNKQVKGVMELASVEEYTAQDRSYFNTISHNIGIAINTAQNRQRVLELLEETQAQAEELQAQHSELENANAELEAQSEKLQASEEELKVQQEELQQANEELEERTRLLEETNELIAERNRDIEEKARQLELSTKYKSEFLANMSHELRTPLNSILLLSKLLAENNEKHLSPSEIEYAQVIYNSGQGLLSLINEILDLSKIESGKMELEYSTVKIEEVFSGMKALLSPVAKEKNLELRFKIVPEAPSAIETDQLRLEQILKNLLSNALKFTDRGSVSLEVSGKDGQVEFKVSDTGIGISKEKQALIFEAFQQADGSTRRKFGGTGLGLSISRELAKLLGGEIHVTSETGKGSVFSLIIPVSQPLAEIPAAKAGIAEKASAQTTQGEPATTKERYIASTIPVEIPDDRSTINSDDKVILIVEDDTVFARTVLDYTREKGYKGIVAVRGDQATALARQYKPSGILLDIKLPVMDGWEVMEELKNSPETRHIPVHIMSVYEFKRKSLLKGAVDFINKPLAFEQMQQMFKKIEQVLATNPKKVLIVEDNPKHAKALAYFLESYNVTSEIKNNVSEGIKALNKNDVNIVILDMGVPDQKSYDTLEEIKKTPGLENIPIIIFTGRSISQAHELQIKQYADSIIIKTAHSYQRVLDEVSLFLHLVDERSKEDRSKKEVRSGQMNDVLKNRKVLVVDDDVRNIFSLTKILEAFQVKVLSAIDGKDALKQLEDNPDLDLVLMDMMMPEMDGYEATTRIRKDARFSSLPIIAVTAKAMTGDREKCINAGASDYITKPVDTDQLLSLLRVWLYN